MYGAGSKKRMESTSTTTTTTDDYDYDSFYAATRQHGSLLLVAWCFLIPCSIAGSVFLKQSSSSSLFYFRFHYITVAFGMMLAVFGYVIGIRSFDTLFPPPHHPDYRSHFWNKAFLHALLGIVVMWGAMLNTLLYLVMGKPPTDILAFDERPRYKKMAQSVHRYMGYIITGLAILTCGIGTRITWVYDNVFGMAYLIAMGSSGIVILALYGWNRQQRPTRTTTIANYESSSGTVEERQRLLI
jgi:hypothetical protein